MVQHAVRGLLSVHVALTPAGGQGYWELTRVRNDLVILLSRVFSQARHIQMLPAHGFVQFHFALTDALTYRVSAHATAECSNHRSLQVWRAAPARERPSTMPSEQRSLTISVRPEFLLGT